MRAWLLSVMAVGVLGCGGQKEQPITRSGIVSMLEGAGYTVMPLDTEVVSESVLKNFPEPPRSSFTARISDKQENSEVLTFLEYSSATKTRVEHLNGFPVRNWFVAGIVSNQMRDAVLAALR